MFLRWRWRTAGLALLALCACHSPRPLELLEVHEVETHWAVDSSAGDNRFIAPVVRFRVANKSGQPQGSIQAKAAFRRGDENLTWGSDFRQLSTYREPLPPDRDVFVMLKSDARYFSTGDPGSMFQHEQFRDAKAEVYLRVGSSPWIKFAEAPVMRRIGARSVEAYAQPAGESR
jgi:hypothetical protein